MAADTSPESTEAPPDPGTGDTEKPVPLHTNDDSDTTSLSPSRLTPAMRTLALAGIVMWTSFAAIAFGL